MTPFPFVRLLSVVALTATIGSAWAEQAPGTPTLNRVKKLYESAAYDEAMAQLDQMLEQDSASGQAASETKAALQYRALCLLALNRTAESEQALERLVLADPEYRPDPTEISPRLTSMFDRARNRMMPILARAQYENARALYDRREYAEAVVAFTKLLARLDDTMLEPSAAAATGDLRLLASGFLELSRAARLPARSIPIAAIQVPGAAAPAIGTIYGDNDHDVVPPVVIAQDLPVWTRQPSGLEGRFEGRIDVVVDEKGDVESVVLAQPIHPTYNELAIAAAKTWRYTPAMRNGAPVKFRKSVGILLFAR